MPENLKTKSKLLLELHFGSKIKTYRLDLSTYMYMCISVYWQPLNFIRKNLKNKNSISRRSYPCSRGEKESVSSCEEEEIQSARPTLSVT